MTIHLMVQGMFLISWQNSIRFCMSFTVRGKLGIGSAHLDGISWAYDNGYSTLITMDCDFTHKPETIPEFLQQSDDHDIVIGSRFLHKESLREWNLYRKAFTHLVSCHT